MNIKTLTIKECNEIMKENSNRWNPVNLKTVHAYTHANISNAQIYLIEGAFTYNALRKEGIKGNLFIYAFGETHNEGKTRNGEKWKSCAYTDRQAWLYIKGDVWLLPCQFPANAWRKADTEKIRKSETQRVIIIASPDIKILTYGQAMRPKKEEPKPSLRDRLYEFKRTRRADELTAYREAGKVAQDLENASYIKTALESILKDTITTKAGADLVDYIDKIGTIKYRFESLTDQIRVVSEVLRYGQGCAGFDDVDNMTAYKRILNRIDSDMLWIMNRVEA